jgi:drug/metabolite transporter (DMT)-like permease
VAKDLSLALCWLSGHQADARMGSSSFLLLPLAAAVIYAAATLMLKRAMWFGLGLWRVTFLANVAMGLLFFPMVATGGGGLPEGVGLAWAGLAGAGFIVGQIFTFLALGRGDASVATPVLGLKTLFVAGLTVALTAESVPSPWWAAAGLSAFAILLLRGHSQVERKRLLPSILFAAAAAATFALTDVLVMKWAPVYGPMRFIPAMFATVALGSFAFIPFFSGRLREIPRPAWPWLAPGALLLAGQALLMNASIAWYGQATAINVVYSSRGLWTVLLVMLAAPLFRSDERLAGGKAMAQRLAGSLLLLAAIGLVLAYPTGD